MPFSNGLDRGGRRELNPARGNGGTPEQLHPSSALRKRVGVPKGEGTEGYSGQWERSVSNGA